MLLSISFILLVGMSMSWICEKNQTAGAAWYADNGNCVGTVCVKSAGSEYTWHFSGFKKNCPDIILTRAGLGLDIAV